MRPSMRSKLRRRRFQIQDAAAGQSDSDLQSRLPRMPRRARRLYDDRCTTRLPSELHERRRARAPVPFGRRSSVRISCLAPSATRVAFSCCSLGVGRTFRFALPVSGEKVGYVLRYVVRQCTVKFLMGAPSLSRVTIQFSRKANRQSRLMGRLSL